VWAGYLVFDIDGLTWVAVGALGGAASLGAVMAIRWVGVYGAGRAAEIERQVAERVALAVGDGHGHVAVVERPLTLGPPERNFPLPVVIAHGFFALITITLVVLTACGVGGS
jgi:hypothetical protein